MPLARLRAYRDPIDAELARMRMEAAGIPAFLFDQHLLWIFWLYSQAIGGVRVMVLERDLERAREALDADHSEALAEELEGRFPGPDASCPACGATDLRRSNVQRNLAAIDSLTSIPLLFFWRRDVCRACGHSWKPPRPSGEIPQETLAAEARVHQRRRFPDARIALALLAVLALLRWAESAL